MGAPASFGIACYPKHGADAETLLQHADVAMYLAKDEHVGHAFYSPERDPYSPDRLTLVGELRRAISDDELVLYYQPMLDLRTAEFTGVEALVRWAHPVRGLLSPDVFVPMAEHTGMIGPLTIWVLDRALGQCAAWRRDGRDLSVAVNLAAQSLLDPLLISDITRLLEKHGVPPTCLALEITESSLMSEFGCSTAALEELSAMGIRLSIDDFGTGYSSLSLLKRLPVDEIKIDKSFVMGMDANANDAVIVRSTVDLGRNLGLRVVAEGVDTERLLSRLRTLGCDSAQGFLLSRPIPAGELEDWFGTRVGRRTSRMRA